MPKVSAVAEEVKEEDEQLRKEFEDFGEAINYKITDKNRPLLIKKLNHLRARRRMSEKLSESVLRESSKERAAPRRGRGKKGRSIQNEPSNLAVLGDKLHTGGGDQLNETFNLSDTGDDDASPAKRKKNIPTSSNNTFVASEGPYAVARKRTAAKGQSSDKPQDELLESRSTSMVRSGVHTESFYSGSSQNLDIPANSDKPKRGRTRTVDDTRSMANRAKVSTESEAIDRNSSSVQQAVKRGSRASAVLSAAKVPSDSVQEASIGESSSSLCASVRNVQFEIPSVEERGRSTNRGRQHKLGEPSKIPEDGGKQSAASRIPKLARFPSPAVSQVWKKIMVNILWYLSLMG